MLNVKLLYRRPDGATAGGVLITEGLVLISSVRRFDTVNGEVETAAFQSLLGSTVALDAGTWRFELWRVPNGSGGYLSGADAITVRAVPASVPTVEIPAGLVNVDGSVDVDDLPEVTVDDSPLAGSPEWKDYVDTAIAGVSAGAPSGGPFVTVASTSAQGRSFIAQTTPGAALGIIGAAATANPIFTGTVTIPDGALSIVNTGGLQTALDSKPPLASPAFTGTPTAPTATVGTNTTQVATTAFVLANGGGGPGGGSVSAIVDPSDPDTVILTF